MTQGDWAAMESLPEIEHRSSDDEGWERLRQRAIGMAWRERRRDRISPGATCARMAGRSPLSPI
jgi:hypothetical protein